MVELVLEKNFSQQEHKEGDIIHVQKKCCALKTCEGYLFLTHPDGSQGLIMADVSLSLCEAGKVVDHLEIIIK